MIESRGAPACKLRRVLLPDEDASLHKLVNDLGTRECNDLSSASLLFLLDRGFLEARKGNEVARDWMLLFIPAFGVQDADELVHGVTTNRLSRGFAFGDGPAGFEAVLGRQIQLAARLVNVETRLLVAKGDEQVGHEPPEEIPATVVFLFKDTDRGCLWYETRLGHGSSLART